MSEAGAAGQTLSAEERETNSAKLSLLARRSGVHALATVANTLLLGLALYGTAPRGWLGLWVLQQSSLAGVLFVRARRQRRSPRGSPRGIRRAAWFCSFAGAGLGSVVLLLPGSGELARLLVLVTLAAMASAASTTLASIPRAAQGYIAGALLLPALFWLSRGELDYVLLALLAGCLASFLVFNARITHDAFLESLGRAREIERLSAQFREERAEWLEWSCATEAFVLLDASQQVLLWNQRFEELVLPSNVERGVSYEHLLSSARVKPDSVGGRKVSVAEWLQSRSALCEHRAGQLEGYADGTFHQVSVHRLENGRQLVTAVDVTALKRTERALREQEHALAQSQRQESVGVIAAGVAHDFNNLLTSIQGAAELLQTEMPAGRGQALLQDIGVSVDRGARLTRQLLAYGRQQSLSPRAIDLNRELESSLPLIRRLLPASVEIRTELASGLHAVFADPEQLQQVIMNLVLNARDAMPKGGVLRLSTTNTTAQQVELCVSDDGIGMSAETVERIFEPFFSTKDLRRGSGLGLSAVQGIIRQSGGSIAVESQPGAGTRMRITLPRSELPVQDAPVSSDAPAPQTQVREALLVVDDEDQVRRLTARLLRRQGYEVIEADHPQAALEHLRSGAPPIGLLLTDVVMPEMSGVELAAAARKLQPALPVVFMSGYEPGLMAAFEAADVLQKPFTLPQLAQAVVTALGGPKRPLSG
jgi:signal transduction histidine kinase/CheY-like chemotaxis protein